MKNLAIIPARSGSKGLADKNIRLLRGKPLIGYTIEAAIDAGVFDTVMVSTDSEKYAEIARELGADVPFLRSEKTASDTASSWDAVLEVIDGYKEMGTEFDTFCLLQPTSPLRSAEDIKGAYDLFNEKKAKFIVSVCEMEHPLSWCGGLPEDLSLSGFVERAGAKQRQKVKKSYRLNGAIYIADINEFAEDHFFYRDGCYAYIMDNRSSVDIDNLEDFEYAEFLLARRLGN
ncbi:acylneuraminate cytidylyltransferase family protein [Butyrivibrio sp. VCD2006]|uniref:acylneuraminate cytidylyltransferase family protein n=1 Tax=Butyrivibrio sp. VCD2006 TaxID=1280664 RepID=UPI0003F60C04|nr:acylneuraminate cytidylyltransferase family protein [Butyrivibrio sp. VCD2006]